MSDLREILAGGTFRVLIHFLLHPDRRLHFRGLQEHTGLGTGALQRELARFEALGVVAREEQQGRVYYQAVADHPSWGAFRTLVRQHADPAEVVREALRDVPGIQAAFVFGSTVRGGARADSDVDVLIVEEGMPLAAIGRAYRRGFPTPERWRSADVEWGLRSRLGDPARLRRRRGDGAHAARAPRRAGGAAAAGRRIRRRRQPSGYSPDAVRAVFRTALGAPLLQAGREAHAWVWESEPLTKHRAPV